jgi:hypothetical protein
VEFLELIRATPTLRPETLIEQGYNTATMEESSILKAVRTNERQYRINIQLTSTIPVSDKHIKAVTCRGRNSGVITEAVEVALGLRKEKKEFVFGNIKSPKAS